jgi:thioredoxin-like negative regulator of GroEL
MNKLIYISSEGCEPCRTFSPIMGRVSKSGIPVTKLDADRDKFNVLKWGVRSIPTVLKMDINGNIIGRFTGVRSEQEVINFYNN